MPTRRNVKPTHAIFAVSVVIIMKASIYVKVFCRQSVKITDISVNTCISPAFTVNNKLCVRYQCRVDTCLSST